MTRYQIRIVDAGLSDLVHEIALQITGQAVSAGGPDVKARDLYPAVFAACKGTLQACVRGFHVCGCARHCDAEGQKTELAPPGADASKDAPRRMRRYILSIDVPLRKFAQDVEFKILRAVAEHSPVKNWRRKLFPIVRKVVEPVLGRALVYSPACNRDEFICQAGACTEFDPWEKVEPRVVA